MPGSDAPARESAHGARIRAALRRGEQDDRTLSGRGFDERYWRTARAAVAKMERELQRLEAENAALRAVIDGG